MGQMFDVSRLIKKYSIPCSLETASSDGQYVGGEWIPGTPAPAAEVKGALIPMKDRKIYQSGGTYTESDREFLTLEKIPLEPTGYLTYQGVRYQVQENTDYSGYAGFYAYNLKRVGAFDR